MIEIFDGHNDSVQSLREYTPQGIDFLERSEVGHLDLVRAAEGGMVGGFFAMWVRGELPGKDDLKITGAGYEVRMAEAVAPEFARAEIARQLAALKSLEQRAQGRIRIATSVDGLEAARRDGIFAMVLHIEGAEAIGPELRELEDLYAEGLRSLGPVWSRPNLFGHGVPFAWPSTPDTGPGLTDAGRDLVRGCNRLGVMIDLAHLNERGVRDVAELSSAPLVATHTCVHAICGSARNLTDRQLDAIRASDGLVGVNLCVNDLRPDGARDENTSLEIVARHFVYLAERIGVDRVALGSDFDGARIPAAIGDAGGLQRLMQVLREHNFSEADLKKIGTENWSRVLRRTWK